MPKPQPSIHTEQRAAGTPASSTMQGGRHVARGFVGFHYFPVPFASRLPSWIFLLKSAAHRDKSRDSRVERTFQSKSGTSVELINIRMRQLGRVSRSTRTSASNPFHGRPRSAAARTRHATFATWSTLKKVFFWSIILVPLTCKRRCLFWYTAQGLHGVRSPKPQKPKTNP